MAEASEARDVAETPLSNPKVNILLVDDQPSNLLVLEAVLAGLGANLVKAYSGEEALRRLLDEDFAVVLLDVQMQGLDGFETAKLIRAREKNRFTPIIFLTAYDSNRLPVEQAYLLGAVDYLVKPLVPVILRAKVAGFIELFAKRPNRSSARPSKSGGWSAGSLSTGSPRRTRAFRRARTSFGPSSRTALTSWS
jgi:CheY-like chemotaxis protein